MPGIHAWYPAKSLLEHIGPTLPIGQAGAVSRWWRWWLCWYQPARKNAVAGRWWPRWWAWCCVMWWHRLTRNDVPTEGRPIP